MILAHTRWRIWVCRFVNDPEGLPKVARPAPEKPAPPIPEKLAHDSTANHSTANGAEDGYMMVSSCPTAVNRVKGRAMTSSEAGLQPDLQMTIGLGPICCASVGALFSLMMAFVGLPNHRRALGLRSHTWR